MSGLIEGEDELKGLFKSILGTEIKIKDNIDSTEELLFATTIQKMEDSYLMERKLLEEFGISIAEITEPLWSIIENDFSFLFGESAKEIIMWYIYERFDSDDNVIPLEGEDGKMFVLNTVNDLWSYIKYKTK
jgi:hypothetical protein